MRSLLAAWRVSLHRTRADWPIVAAAWLIVLLAATLLAAGPIYSSSVSLAGLHRTLDDAAVTAANIEVSARVPRPEVEVTVPRVTADLHHISDQIGTDVVEAARSDTFALADQPAQTVRDLLVFGFLQGVESHATLLSGTWPKVLVGLDGPPPAEIAVSEQIAYTLGWKVGDAFEMVSRLDPSLTTAVGVAAIYRITDPGDPFWWNDPTLLEGFTESAQYRTIGPLLMTHDDLLSRAAGSTVALTWHAYPQFRDLAIDGIGPLRAELGQLSDKIAAGLTGGFPVVRTTLGEILAESERALLVSRTGILLLMAQLAILAAYAIVLTAALIVDHRRVDTALLRSRGAGPWQISGLALAEALLLAVPAALAGPWLAAAALRLLNLGGPLAGIGLVIEPLVTGDAYLAASVAAIGCALLLVLPALLAARSFAAEQAGRSRHETRTMGQRLGFDVALLSVTVVAIWQLRLYGAPLTRSVHGAVGLDPLLVAAPAIGLLAGGVLALRLLPLVAQGAEEIVSGGRDLVGSLGARQLARRPLRYTRASLLLMLAMSMGVFAVSYAATWSNSQHDQAQFQVGADLRVTPASGPFALPEWSLATAYARIPGVSAVMPVERQGFRVTPSAVAGEVIALEPDAAAAVVQIRADQTNSSVGALVQPLVDARPPVDGIEVPGAPQRLQVTMTVPYHGLSRSFFDPGTGTVTDLPVDPLSLGAMPVLRATIYLRDAAGLIHRFSSDFEPWSAGPAFLVPLSGATTSARDKVLAAGAGLTFPLQVIGVDLGIGLPTDVAITSGTLGLVDINASDETDGPAWQAVNFDRVPRWQIGWSQDPSLAPEIAGAGEVENRSVVIGGGGAFTSLPGTDFFGRGVTVRFIPSGVAEQPPAKLAAIVNHAFLAQTAAKVGDLVTIPLEGGERDLRVIGTIGSFPATSPSAPIAIVDLQSLQFLRFGVAHTVRPPTEWWLSAPGTVGSGTDEAAFAGAQVLSRVERTASLSADPLALGITGALTLGFAVAALFAVVGLGASAAVSVRQRRGEFALLRALGLSGGQLSGWLWLENATLVIVSLVAGTGLGLLIGWVVLPFVTVTQQAAIPFPPVIVETPWSTILVLEAVTAGALAITVVGLAAALRRSGVGSVLRMGGD